VKNPGQFRAEINTKVGGSAGDMLARMASAAANRPK
jgi:hypothetical protein